MADNELRELLSQYNEDILFADGYDDCIVGIAEQFGRPAVAVYDKLKLIQRLVEDGMTDEEASEYFDYNIIGAYVGESTPVFVTIIDDLKETW